MSAYPSTPLGSCVLRVETWNPLRAEPDEEFRYVDLSAVDQDTKSITEAREIACADAPSRARQLVRSGDVLVSTVRPNLNGVARVHDDLNGATASTGFCVLRPDPEKLSGSYLFHWVKSAAFVGDMVSKATGASYPAVSDRIIFESLFPLAPLEEQRRIAAILDQAETLRTQRRTALALLDSLTQSLFLDMFGNPVANPKGWAIGKIGDMLESASYGTSEKSGTEGEFPVLRMNNITRNGDLDLGDLKYMDLHPTDHKKYLVRAGDVLFNRTNSAELVGKAAIVPASAPPLAYAGYLVRLRVNEANHPMYLARFLNTPYAKRMLRGMCKSIVGMANINAKEIQAMRIALPPLPLQQTFAPRIAAIEALKATHRHALAALDALFASLQQRAFAGQL